MQSASVNYVQAASAAGGVWAAPLVRSDWWGDGFSNAATAGPGFVFDDFNRVVGSTWESTTPLARPYSNTGGLVTEHYVSSGFGYQLHATANDIHRALVDLGHVDADVMVNITLSGSATTGASTTSWVVARAADVNNYYGVQLVLSTAGVVSLQPLKRVNGTLAGLGGATTVGTHVAGGTWRIHLRLSGTTLTTRAWLPATTDEPADWQTTTTGLTELTTGTNIGLLSRRETGNTDANYLFAWSELRAAGGGLDDMSRQFASWSVTHHLDDGFPDSATFISGEGYGQATIPLVAPPAYLTGGVPLQVAEHYSPYNPMSPVYGLERDIAPTTIDHGVITPAGPERIRIFTGQMTDIPVKSGKAVMSAISATRLALSKLVQPPAFAWPEVGLNGTWPVSWALAQCGLYVGPPPRDGCRWWMPMHGSTRPFIPSTNVNLESNTTFWQGRKIRASTGGVTESWRPTFISGPYVLAPDTQISAVELRRVVQALIEFGDGDDIYSQAGNKARLEFWVKGDPAEVNNVPGGSASISRLAGLRSTATVDSSVGFNIGVNRNRQGYVSVNDGAGHGMTLSTLDTLPTDGAWYFFGGAYDVAGKRLWVTNFNGSTRSTGWSPAVTSSLPTTDTWGGNLPDWVSYLPVSEVQLSTGVQANVDNFPTWLNAVAFTPGAVLTPSVLELQVVAERQPVEAWEFISRYAQAELAAMRTDENDIFRYLGLGYWVQDAQRVVVELISTETNADTPDLNIDPTKIRNTIGVSFSVLEIPATRIPAYTLSQQLVIAPGVTTVTFPFQNPVVALSNSDVLYLTDADLGSGVALYANLDYVTLNSATDGTGTYADSDTITIEKLGWDAGGTTWRFTNNSFVTFYTANASNVPTLQVSGYPVTATQTSVVDANDASVARRGERSLSVSGSLGVQTDVDARRLARDLKLALRRPVPIMDTVQLFGEARRQPGDLVQFTDPSVTRASGQWRSQSVTHDFDGAEYTNSVIFRPTKSVGVWGSSTWGGDVLWGESSE